MRVWVKVRVKVGVGLIRVQRTHRSIAQCHVSHHAYRCRVQRVGAAPTAARAVTTTAASPTAVSPAAAAACARRLLLGLEQQSLPMR